MRGEGSWRRRPKRQWFAKVSCDAEGPQARVRGANALDLMAVSNNCAGGEVIIIYNNCATQLPRHGSSSTLAQPLWVHPCAAEPVPGPLEMFEVVLDDRESAKNLLVKYVFPINFLFGWKLLAACPPLLPKQLCVREL